ncbi:hypothetical protein FGG08_002136 [Glutinoglossum americanum]|uniref:Uncharacterized protein n=1 Tax=Glutinoglossum americanum TaxID=1670608 RepID=A0A9P8IC89_9PEZI|nr:hypothetical protein FGG08_002136 [Glutinoglossum americanum]
MTFTLIRRPPTITSSFFLATKQIPKSISPSISVRSFHIKPSPNTFFTSRPTPKSTPTLSKSRHVLQQSFRRTYMQEPVVQRPDARSATQRLLYGAGIFGGTLVAINLLFNRETREDGGMPTYERGYLNETFLTTGLGIGIIGIAARTLHHSGWSYRLMATNPWLVVGVSLAASIGSMYGTFATSPDNYIQKYALWTVFNVTQAAVLSPLMFLQPALLARAGLYTVGLMGSIAFVGATAKQEKYLYLGGPLLAGVAVVALSGLAPLVLPATAARTLLWTENIWLYGGLAVFGGFTLYDVQKVLHHARLAERGIVRRDAVNESISLELDFLNIFIRLVQILGMRSNNNRR